jgi:hypothetical protein
MQEYAIVSRLGCGGIDCPCTVSMLEKAGIEIYTPGKAIDTIIRKLTRKK